MKALTIPILCFAAGIGCGALIFRHHSEVEKPPPGDRIVRTPLRSAISTPAIEEPQPIPAITRPSLTNLANDDQKLIDLALRASSTSSRMLDFERATQHLTANQLFALADKSEHLPVPYSTLKWARNNLIARAARLDPEAALQHANAISDRDARYTATRAVYIEIAQHDSKLAVTMLAEITDPETLRRTIGAILGSGAEGAPAAILDLLTRQDLPLDRFELGALGSATTPETLDQSLQLLDRLPSSNQKRAFLKSAISSLAKSDPQTALTLIESHSGEEESGTRHVLLAAMGKSWLLADPEKARTWITSLPDPADRASALTAMTASSGEHRQWLVDQLATLPQDEPYTKKLARSLASEWGMRSPQETLHWIGQLPPGEIRDSIARSSTNSYARDWASLSPQTATAWAESLPEDDPVRHQMVDAFVQQWASQDFEDARHWSEQLPDETSRNTALNSLITSTIGNDLQLAAEIYNDATLGLTAEQSEPFARSTTAIAMAWAKQDPAATFAWAEALANETQKLLSLDIAVKQWKRTDPDTARSAIEAADIDGESRAKLLNRLPK